MPQEIKREHKRSHHTGSQWHKFHFSGKVIMCSVLFGLGLVLIGGLIFAIASDSEDKPKSNTDSEEIDVSSKAPTSFVGSAIMGIGGFIVIVGIIMCLFETEICRKRSSDSSPLIAEGQNDSEPKDTDPARIPSSSKTHDDHRHGARKISPSPRRHKRSSKKPHSSKDRSHKKGASPSSPPMAIEKSNKFLTTSTSEEQFITPPNTLRNETMVLQSNSRNAENQTSSSLMKSFTSSGPSWNVSAEFQTPATSFRDTSPSLEDSTRISEMESSMSSVNTQVLDKQKVISEGFLTPVTPPDEKVKNFASNIQKWEAEVIKEGHSQKDTLNAQEEIKNADSTFINNAELTVGSNGKDLNSDKKSQTIVVQIQNEINETEQENLNGLPLSTAEENSNNGELIADINIDTRSIPQTMEIQREETNETDIVDPSISVATDLHSTEYVNIKNDKMLISEIPNENTNDTGENSNLSNEMVSNESNFESVTLCHIRDSTEGNECEVVSTVINISENSEKLQTSHYQFSGDTENLKDQSLHAGKECDIEFNTNENLNLPHVDSSTNLSFQHDTETSAEIATSGNIKSVKTPENNPGKTTDLWTSDSHPEFPVSDLTEKELISKDIAELKLNGKDESPKVDLS